MVLGSVVQFRDCSKIFKLFMVSNSKEAYLIVHRLPSMWIGKHKIRANDPLQPLSMGHLRYCSSKNLC